MHRFYQQTFRQRLLPVLLCLSLLLGSLAAGLAAAETVDTGTVHVDDALRVRSGPGTSYATIGWLKNNDVVTILETVNPDNGKWDKITKDSLCGYSSADYITINARYESDADFEAYLSAQGFPESYKPGLRQLHAQYPQWVFRAQTLSMTWETALAAECRVGRNTIRSPEAWKSMEYGAYDWTNGCYVVFDSGGWVSAAPAVIAYYMDPRNFLDSTYVFQFEELSYSPEHTADGVRAILPAALRSITGDLLAAAKASGVSAYYLAAKIVQEGTDKNGLGTGTVSGYKGYYNFFDIGAYAHDGRSAVENGAIYAKSMGWDTPYKCLLDSANSIGKNYIQRGQNTTYYQKFNVVNTASGLYGHQYMTNTAGAASEGAIRRQRTTEEQLNANLTFVIPVYPSMPETASPRPSTSGNNNNFLGNITVSGCSLTPTFDRYTDDYAVQVGAEVSRVTVSGTLCDSGAKLDGGGEVALQPGTNVVSLTVTATSGAVRTYTVTITREPGGTTEEPVITGKTYAIGDTVTRVEPNTPVGTFLQTLAVTGGTADVCNSSGEAKTDGFVATGDILRLYSGSRLCASYPVVIYGDVNGDGLINSLDLRRAQKHILALDKLTGYSLAAADSNRDSQLNSLDLRATQKFILKLTSSLQP